MWDKLFVKVLADSLRQMVSKVVSKFQYLLIKGRKFLEIVHVTMK